MKPDSWFQRMIISKQQVMTFFQPINWDVAPIDLATSCTFPSWKLHLGHFFSHEFLVFNN